MMNAECDYLLYNSTISCSFIFSGILSLSGYAMKVPFISASFQSSQLILLFLPFAAPVIPVLPWVDFQTNTISWFKLV